MKNEKKVRSITLLELLKIVSISEGNVFSEYVQTLISRSKIKYCNYNFVKLPKICQG